MKEMTNRSESRENLFSINNNNNHNNNKCSNKNERELLKHSKPVHRKLHQHLVQSGGKDGRETTGLADTRKVEEEQEEKEKQEEEEDIKKRKTFNQR